MTKQVLKHMIDFLWRIDMTREEAITKLRETGEVTTGMLDALNINFETWLRYAQLGPKEQRRLVQGLLEAIDRKARHT